MSDSTNLDFFSSFQDYWGLTKNLSEFQRKILFKHLPKDQQDRLIDSYKNNGWLDLFIRNKIDKALDYLKNEKKIDVLFIKCKVSSGKSHFLNSKEWNFAKEHLLSVAGNKKHLSFLFNGIKEIKENEDCVCLIKK
jgi:hypothetical protein